VELLKQEINYRGLSVFIASRPCIHNKRREKAEEHKAERKKNEVEPAESPTPRDGTPIAV
jgi:TPP-dependent indolepyruvate ferredoxin oxidoreductase alpha subunit